MESVEILSEPDRVEIRLPKNFKTSMTIAPNINVDINPPPQFIEIPAPQERVEDQGELSFDIRPERLIARVHGPLVPPFNYACLENVERYRPRGPPAHEAAAAPHLPPTAPRAPHIPPSGDSSRQKGLGPRGGGPASKTKSRCPDTASSDAPLASTSSGRASAHPRLMTVSPYYPNHIPLAQYGRISRQFRPYAGRNSIPPKIKNVY